MNDKISLQLPYKTEYLSLIRITTSSIANQLNFNIEQIDDIKLAVCEACNNAILHSNSNEGCFDINFYIKEQSLSIEIIDQGNGFNIDEYVEPNIDQPKESGLGFYIMKSLMDDVQINTIPDSGTKIVLTKHIL